MLDFLYKISELTSEYDVLLFVFMLSLLSVFIFSLTFLTDVIHAVYRAMRKQPYEWKCLNLLTSASEGHSAGTITVLSAFLIIGFMYSLAIVADEVTREYEKNLVVCDNCHKKFDEDFNSTDFDDPLNIYKYLCPNCLLDDIGFVIDAYYQYGLDDGDSMIVERAECNWCGNDAPADLYDENDESICIDCITEALHNRNVARAVQNYLEYG